MSLLSLLAHLSTGANFDVFEIKHSASEGYVFLHEAVAREFRELYGPSTWARRTVLCHPKHESEPVTTLRFLAEVASRVTYNAEGEAVCMEIYAVRQTPNTLGGTDALFFFRPAAEAYAAFRGVGYEVFDRRLWCNPNEVKT